jgi:predicted RNA-binding Zn ribbon-like protein
LTLRWSPDGQAFQFDAGALCLELLTTGGSADHPGYEALVEPRDLERWLTECRLHLGATVQPRDIRTAHELRGAIWQAALAAIEDRSLPGTAVAAINELAERVPPVPALAGDRRHWVEATGDQAMSAIARDAVELFGGPYARRVRRCASGDCALVFVDLSRPGQRRWCAMQRCGNRAKQRTRRR